MKTKILILISVIFIFLTSGCAKVNNAKISINNNDTHTNKDINKVIKRLKSDFKHEFSDCNGELLNIEYNNISVDKKWNDIMYYDVIKLEFEFVCKKNTQTLLKDNTYGYNAYYGKKTKNSSWQRIDWGQG